MVWTPTVYSVLALGAAAGSVALAATAADRDESYARSFRWLILAMASWTGLYGVQLGFTPPAFQLATFRAVTIAGGVVPTLWLVFAATYAGVGDRLRAVRPLLIVEPVVFAVAVLTNAWHGLFWSVESFTPAGPVGRVLVDFGTVHYLHMAYSYVLVVVGVAVLVRVAVVGPTVSTRQSVLLLAGAVPPFLVNVAEFTVGVPAPVGTTPFAFAVTGGVWGLALFRFDLLDRTAPARQRALGNVGTGLAVTDENGRVVEIDELARAVFDGSPAEGDTLRPAVPDGAEVTRLDGSHRTAVIDDRRRVFDTSVEAVSDHRGQTTGYAVVVHDVTERHAYEKRLEVANRVLRHNLSNELNVVLGHANHVADATGDPELATAAEEIRTAAVGLQETSEKARELVGSERHHGEPEPVAVAEPTRHVAAEFGSAAEIRLSVTDTRAVVGSRQAYTTAVENVVENAVEHHDGDPTVWIEIEETDDEVVVTVADDGPGIPETDRAAVERGSETPLEHTSGLGLWIAHWTATAVGGELRLGDREPRGTRVELRLPAVGSAPDDTEAEALADPGDTRSTHEG